MGTNLKNTKMSHFGGGSGSGFGISAGKLLTNNSSNSNNNSSNNNSNSNGSSSAAGSAANAPSSGSSNNNKQASADNDVLAMLSGAIIPLIRSRDVAKQLPTLAAALQRPADDYLAAEDLDAVQLELELMLSNVALRARVLKAEYDSLDKDEKRQDRRKLDRLTPASPPVHHHGLLNGILSAGAGGSGSSLASGIAGSAGNLGGNGGVASPANATGNSSKRKLRDEPTGVRKKHSSMTILKQQQHLQGAVAKQLNNKNSPMNVHTDDSMDYMPLPTTMQQQQQQHSQQHQQQQQLPKVSMPKNDMPNKFWLSIEPYCMPLTNEDLRLIDDLLEQYRGPLVPPVPSLGPHYASVWAQEDMKSLQPGGARQKAQNATASMLKKGESMLQESITGPLTQRLVSALMDESLPSEQAAIGEQSSSSNNSNSNSIENTHASANFRSLALLKHGVGIEQRLKKELVESGLLDANDLTGHNADNVDEVLLEIKRVTAEISTVAQFNSEELKRLRAAASEEIKRIELKRKLDAIDQEILECYKRMLQYRAKRKGHSNEEKQEILRLTNEQRALAEQLERMQVLSTNVGTDSKL